ncbi:hypothetical protein A0O21_04865 [Streptococcus pantholopis]|uniref:Uncharacterized protein n=2 Tax=Streptococcus pantholopis TaxID=1811193 RepID=A0A172QA98_9STRE|nr:hypothetical protein A0O21_04865 [Streptococcus pantholopis]
MLTKETLTKRQQDNVVKRIAKSYDIESIEFLNFRQDPMTGTYHLKFKINGDDKLQTGLSVSKLSRFDNSTDNIGLDPVETFAELKKSSIDNNVNIDSIYIKYLGE